jgi:hypothetical protein
VTSNYNLFTNSHVLQFTTADTWVFSVCCVFTGCRLVTASNGRRFPSSGFRTVLSYSNSRLTDWMNDRSTNQPTQLSLTVLFINISARTRRKHRFSLQLYPTVAVETCLFVKPLLSVGCLCWLHSSCLEQICHIIISISFYSIHTGMQKYKIFRWFPLYRGFHDFRA